ncbi:type IV secretory system conjugative DNA transfer family protein [Actinomadura nitritigenes]|uniref:type IV secretory system conjugative DNA transfer family protein n=1 Tax=Actinomadura nitritigenes TaxID=134602 RepID=UPI003D94D151
MPVPLLIVIITSVPAGGYFAVRLFLNVRRRRTFRRLRLGFASGWEVRRLLGAQAVLRKAPLLRPSFENRPMREVRPEDVGFCIGRDIRSRRKLYASVEDPIVVVAAPRQGKDVHFVTPFTIDAPGPCIVTSTRRETFVNTAMVRARHGRVYVFDPYDWTGWPHRMRWNYLEGCEDANVAGIRSGALVWAAGFRMEKEGGRAVAGATTIVRCLLHAGAVAGLTVREVARWVYEADADEAVDILRQAEREGRGAPGYAAQLDFNRRDGRLWAAVMQVMSCFSIPRVVDDLSPTPDERFDFNDFLKGRNTLYLITKRHNEPGSIAPVVADIVEEFFALARRAARIQATGRLDPPLTFELNQVTDICPLPELPTYVGDSGAYGIGVHTYLTSLAEAHAEWGPRAAELWDNSTVRIIAGGGGTAGELAELSEMVGRHRGRPALYPEEIRTLSFGRAALVAGTARPVEMWLTPWWKRADRDAILAGKHAVEEMIRKCAAGQGPAARTAPPAPAPPAPAPPAPAPPAPAPPAPAPAAPAPAAPAPGATAPDDDESVIVW